MVRVEYISDVPDPRFDYTAWKIAVKALHGDVQIFWSLTDDTGTFKALATNGNIIVRLDGTKPETFERDFPDAPRALDVDSGA